MPLTSSRQEMQSLQASLWGNALQADSQMLEEHIKNLQASMGAMTEFPSNKSRMYVTNDDIIKLQSIGEDVVFAVTAPHGTTLVVPDPDEGVENGGSRRYRCPLPPHPPHPHFPALFPAPPSP